MHNLVLSGKQMNIKWSKFLLLLLSFETLGLPTAIVQTTPPIYLFCIISIPFFLRDTKFTPNLQLLLFFLSYATLLSLGYFFFEIFNSSTAVTSLRIINFLRQFSSLLLGVLLFIVVRRVIENLGIETALRYVIMGIIPIFASFLILDLSNFIASPNTYRSQGYFSEPSHLAEYIVQIIFGSIYIYTGLPNHSKKITNYGLLFYAFLGVLLILITSSGTGVIRIILLVLGIFLFETNKQLKRIILAVFLILSMLAALFFYFMQDVYLVNIVSSLPESRDEISSFVDRYYSFVGPFSKSLQSKVLLGYGLGGDSIYFNEFYPNEFIEIVQSVKNGGFSLVSFWGKIYVFTGVIGMLIWGTIIYNAFKKARIYSFTLKIRAIIFSIFIYGFIGGGAFLFVHTWFWLAVLDGLGLLSKNYDT
ncbi:MAG: hypothetical protein ACOVQE_01575 [Chitinophagaceae bacterium]